ncbi:FK506-binding protein-like [Babylonia areolata]|uniref:FK506-binding protein-like n=1 Tax=Babylonia areolata TaxID=304850 RepID=UPI003FD0FD8A
MDTGAMEHQTTTMEIDGETSAMDTCDGGTTSSQDAWKGEDPASSDMMNTEHKMTNLPVHPEPCGTVSSETPQDAHSKVWRLPEGVCEKRVVQKGEGLCGPVWGASCTVTIQCASDLDLSHLGYSAGQSTVQLGEGVTPMSCLIDAALMSMKKGETAEVCVSGLKNLEGQFVFHITLHHFTSATPSWRLTPAEKCASAAAHKEKGAKLFKEGNVFAAFSQFRIAVRILLSILPYYFEDDESAAKSHQQLLCQCYLNLAACQMKSGHHGHVITNCTQALNLDPSNVKAMFRRASANVSLGNYLLAQEDLEMGLKKEPNNRALLDLMHTVNSKLAVSESQMAQGLSKMFS